MERADAMLSGDPLESQRGESSIRRKRVLPMLGRIGLSAAAAILAINLWTGIPLLALWVGSQATGGRVLSMTGVLVAVLSLGVLLTLGVMALSRISRAHDRLAGRPPAARQPAPWLMSMRASKVRPPGHREVNAIEAIVVAAVVLAFIAFEVWFFLLAKFPVSG